MRPLLILAVLFALPGLYLLWNDYIKYQNNPTDGFHISTIGEVWLEHDRSGFLEFKAEYKGNPRAWNEDIRPKLDWQALPLAVLPALIFYLGLFLCWLLGRGPFADWSVSIPRGARDATGATGFSRKNATQRGGNINYRRK